MFTDILVVDQSSSLEQGRLMDFDINDLLFTIDDKVTAEDTSIDDFDSVLINVRLRRGKTELLVDHMRLSDLLKVSNAYGGNAFNSSDTVHYARLPLGNFKIKGNEVLEVEISGTDNLTDVEISVSAIDNRKGREEVLKYEGLTAGGDNQSFSNVISILSVDDYSGSATINDGVNTIQITAQKAEMIANSSMRIETRQSQLGLVYDTPTGPRNVTAKLPVGNYIVLGRL